MTGAVGQLSASEAERAAAMRSTERLRGPGPMSRLRSAIGSRWAAFLAWQSDIPDQGRVVVVGLAFAAIGLLPVWWPAAALVPGLVLVLVGLGFDFRHPATATALVAGVALIVLTAIVVGGMT
jgi:hypothetical protein